MGSTVRVVSTKAKPKRVKWQRCPVAVTSNFCPSPERIGRGRTHTLDAESAGLSVRAVATIKGRTAATKWSRPVSEASSGGVVVPQGWVVTGGSPASITTNQSAISNAYAEIARLVRGGRFLSHLEGSGGDIFIQRELTLCSDNSFRFIDAPATNVTGTWQMTVNFTNPQDLAPRLVLSAGGQPESLVVDVNPNRAGHVLLNGEDFLSGPSSSCS